MWQNILTKIRHVLENLSSMKIYSNQDSFVSDFERARINYREKYFPKNYLKPHKVIRFSVEVILALLIGLCMCWASKSVISAFGKKKLVSP